MKSSFVIVVSLLISVVAVAGGNGGNRDDDAGGKNSGAGTNFKVQRGANGGGIGRVEFVRGNEGNRAAVDGAGTNSLARDGGTNGKSVSGGGGGGIGN